MSDRCRRNIFLGRSVLLNTSLESRKVLMPSAKESYYYKVISSSILPLSCITEWESVRIHCLFSQFKISWYCPSSKNPDNDIPQTVRTFQSERSSPYLKILNCTIPGCCGGYKSLSWTYCGERQNLIYVRISLG